MMKKYIKLYYGSEEYIINTSELNIIAVLKPAYVPPPCPIEKLVLKALNNSIKISFTDLVKGKNTDLEVVLVSDDITRPTPTKTIIPIIIDTLNSLGIKEDRIKVLVALGSHRKMSRNELERKFGKGLLERIKVLQHDAWDKNQLVYIGETSSGIPIWINKHYYEADIKIGIGNIVPHPAAGWSGGSKIIMPGVSGARTVGLVHFHSALYDIEEIYGIRDNPVRREFDEIALKSGLKLIVNTIQNALKEVVDVVIGDVIDAHRAGVEIAEKIYRPIAPQADIALISAYPYDVDYWQAGKGYLGAYLFLRKGGAAILVAKLPEGVSSVSLHKDELLNLGRLSPREIEERIRENKVNDLIAASIALVMAKARRKIRLYIITEGLTDKECEKLGLIKVDDVRDVVNEYKSILGREPRIVVMEDSSIAPAPSARKP